ncbi:uncharacterized protein LOC108469776 isoform X3 [Gossypium arboreum]|uniref:uncharacterized protein LOC108469776 isoform X3 n=1 Tax=Gossypium arboreum TaxID=29729 RepID=UPI000819088B|nr:uncharacterized protein LOC108469776 isoform X3 [Gossypium arboreum]
MCKKHSHWSVCIDGCSSVSVGMKNLQNTQDIKPSVQASNESKTEQQNNQTSADSASSNDGQKVSRQDIELVQNLIERCLQLYMNKDEVVKTLLNRARIDPGFTILVWQKLEEENADFFKAYYIRLKLKKQILLFNHLLEHQYYLMKYPMPPKVPLVPIQNGIHPMPAAGQPHLDSMGISSCHVVNEVPAPSHFQPMQMNSGNDMVMDNNATDATPAVPPTTAMMSSMSEMPVSPTSVASSGNFPFTATDMSEMGVDTATLDSAFTADVASSIGLQLGPGNGADNSRDSLRSLDQIQWNFSLTDLTADFSNLGDLVALGNHPGSPFLPSDSEIMLGSSEHENIVEEFFVDSIPGQPCTPSDEEK